HSDDTRFALGASDFAASDSAASVSSLFSFNDTATTEIYTLSLHDALPIFVVVNPDSLSFDDYIKALVGAGVASGLLGVGRGIHRSEEHTSELQSRRELVCRLLLEKKKSKHRPNKTRIIITCRRRTI